MDGISHEDASLPVISSSATIVLRRQRNSIDGKVVGWYSEDTPKRFEAYGWQRGEERRWTRRGGCRRRHQEGTRPQDQPRSSAARPSSAGVRPTSRARSPHTARPRSRRSGECAPDARLGACAVRRAGRHPRAWDPRKRVAAEKKWLRVFKRYKRNTPQPVPSSSAA